VRPNTRGYNLNSKFFTGFSVSVGYHFIKWLAFEVTYTKFFSKTGRQYLEWMANPEGSFSEYHGSFNIEYNYFQQDIQLIAELYPGLYRLYFMIGWEISYCNIVRNRQWTRYRGINQLYIAPYSNEEKSELTSNIIGLGYELKMEQKLTFFSELTYSFDEITSGLKLNTGIRLHLIGF